VLSQSFNVFCPESLNTGNVYIAADKSDLFLNIESALLMPPG